MTPCNQNRGLEMDYSEHKTEQLYRLYANCCATAAGAMGHTKSHYNEVYAEKIATELQRRGETVPGPSIARKFGSFNGEGSF